MVLMDNDVGGKFSCYVNINMKCNWIYGMKPKLVQNVFTKMNKYHCDMTIQHIRVNINQAPMAEPT